jgi:soluble lytic murein transglycosylase
MLVFFLSFTCSDASAGMYKYVDENGVATFTDVPPEVRANRLIAYGKKSVEKDRAALRYGSIIMSKASKYDIDPSLIKAVIAVESNFNSRAVSRKGAMGLMQLMPETAEQMGVFNPFSPEDNIEGGTRYLKRMLQKFNGDLRLALAAYNAGPTRVENCGTVPPIKETLEYIRKIFAIYVGGRHIVSGKQTGGSNAIYKIVLKDGSILYTNSSLHTTSPPKNSNEL